MKKKLIFISIVLLSCSAIALNSCGESSSNRDNSLIYWSSNNTQEIQFADSVVSAWNRAHPDNKVKTQPVPEGQSSEEIILAAVVGNTTPDIYSNMWQGDVEDYARAGKLVAFDTLKGFNNYIYSRCDSAVIKEVTSQDGHIYQIPWKINPIMMMYNNRLMSQIGYSDPPKDYSDYLNAASNLKAQSIKGGYVNRWIGYAEVLVTWWQRFFDFYPLYLAASGGAPLVKDNKAVFDNKYAVEVFKFLRKLYSNNYFSRERLSVKQDVFLSGIIATRFTGPWEISHADKFKPKGFQFGFTHMPVPDDHKGPVYTYCDPKNIVIFKTCPNPELAWKFIKFMIDEKNDLELLKFTNQLPRRKNLESDTAFADYFSHNPKMVEFARQAKYVRGTDPVSNLTEVFDIISQEYEASVIYGEKSPEEALKEAAKQVNLLYLK